MKYPWMPLFWGDFLANTLDLSAQEIGAYVLLIAHAWEREAEICVKDAQRIARVDNRHWGDVRAKLDGFFEPVGGLQGQATVVRHPRVAKELANAGELSSKRKHAAMQMHANRRASASVLHQFCIPHSHSLESSLGKVREAPSVQVHGLRPPTTATWRPRIDETEGYRSPPKKSDNDLADPNREDLKALEAKAKP
jgi:uncharacterized protein YdaU (DUF1376 family)